MRESLSKVFCIFICFVLSSACSVKDIRNADPILDEQAFRDHSAKQENKAIEQDLEHVQKTTVNSRVVKSSETHDDELKTLIIEKASMELGRPVIVIINHKKQLDDWIFLVGAPKELNGDPLDYSSTNYATQSAEGMVDDVFLALVNRSEGKWAVLAFSIGSTDAPFFDWRDRFGVPLSLFSDKEN